MARRGPRRARGGVRRVLDRARRSRRVRPCGSVGGEPADRARGQGAGRPLAPDAVGAGAGGGPARRPVRPGRLLPGPGREAGLLARADGHGGRSGVPGSPRQRGRALRRGGRRGHGQARRHGGSRHGRPRYGRPRHGQGRHGQGRHGRRQHGGRVGRTRPGQPARPVLPQPHGPARHLAGAEEGLDGDGLHPRLRGRGRGRKRRDRLARQGPADRRADRGRGPAGRGAAGARARHGRPRRAARDRHSDPVRRLRRPRRERHDRRPRPEGPGPGPRLLTRDQRGRGPVDREPRLRRGAPQAPEPERLRGRHRRDGAHPDGADGRSRGPRPGTASSCSGPPSRA